MSVLKLVVVVGGTGTQGGSVISALSKDPAYRIRAITRNTASASAQNLAAQGIEIVAADSNDVSSLIAAFKGAHIIFSVTDFMETFATQGAEAGIEADLTQGKNLTDAAAATPTLEHYIWSTIPSASVLASGKISVPHFEGKAKVDEYILDSLASLAEKTTFLWVGSYGLNCANFPPLMPNYIKTALKYIVMQPCSPNTPLMTIGSPNKNVGAFVEAVIKKPELTLPAKYVLAEVETVTTGKLVELIAEISGKMIEYVQVSVEDYNKVWPSWGLEVALQQITWESVGDKSWTKEGVTPVTKENLKITGLQSLKDSLASVDWSSVL